MAEINCFLKHRDLDVALMKVDIDYGYVTDSMPLIPEHLPLSAESTGGLSAWWQRRAVPETQDFLNEQLENLSTSNHSLLTKNLGLSLNDAYWICPIELSLSWNDVNLYEHDFSSVPSDSGIDFDTTGSIINLNEVGSFFPGSSLQGNLKKRWIKKNSDTYLVKGNYKYFQQSLNERFSSLLHKKQNTDIAFAEYELANVLFDDTEEIACISKNFTSTEIEYVPARDILWSFNCRSKEEQSPESYIQCLIKLGMDETKVRKGIWYQNLTDFILTNEDRHLNNYGILRNPKNLEPISLAPIFDTGNSMFWEGIFPRKQEELFNIKINRAERKEINLIQLLDRTEYGNLVNFHLLPSTEEVVDFYVKHDIPEEQAMRIGTLFTEKIKYLEY